MQGALIQSLIRQLGPHRASLVAQIATSNAGDLGLIPGSGRSLEKEMASHSSTVAWTIPWMEEPGGLQSIGSQRVGQD